MKRILPFTVFAACILFASTLFGQANAKTAPQKLTAEQVIQKHLESIGSEAARRAVNSRVLVGTGLLEGRVLAALHLNGPTQFASQGDKLLLAMIFNLKDYPYEKVGFDGDDVTVGRPFGNPSDLGEFLKSDSSILQLGLLGGALSTDWALAVPHKGLKFEYGGIKDLGTTKAYRLKVDSSKLNGLAIDLYFDTKTFHHVMSEYTHEISARPTLIVGVQQNTEYHTMTETFSDFTKAGDLVLPLGYQIDVLTPTASGTRSMRWKIKFTDVYNDQVLDPGVFKVS